MAGDGRPFASVESKDGVHFFVTSECYVYVLMSRAASAFSQPGPAETAVLKRSALTEDPAVRPTANFRECAACSEEPPSGLS
jgi:hypothetical protein